MIKEKSKVQAILETIFVNAVDKLVKEDTGRLIDSLCVQVDTVSGEIQLYDDRETLLEKNIIFDWADRGTERFGKGVRSHKQPVNTLRTVLTGLKAKKIFDNPVFMRPLNVLLVDDAFCEIEQIFTFGCEDTFLEGGMMKN
jgi:hypothetical protein